MKRAVWSGVAAAVLIGAAGAVWLFLERDVGLDELRSRYGPAFDAKRQAFRRIAERLPPVGSVGANVAAKGLAPPPVCDVKAGRYTLELAMAKQLVDPDVDLRAAEEFDASVSEPGLVARMTMVGPASKLRVAVPRATLPEFDSALALTYLAVARPVTYLRPRALAKDAFTAGAVDLEVFVVDLRTEAIVAQGRCRAETADRTTAFFRKHQDEGRNVEAAAHSTLWVNARRALASTLRDLTGGTFEFER